MLKKILALGMMVSVVNADELDSYDSFTTGDLGKIIIDAVQDKLKTDTLVQFGDHGISQENLLKLVPAIRKFGCNPIYEFYMSLFPDYYNSGLTEEQAKSAGKLHDDLQKILNDK